MSNAVVHGRISLDETSLDFRGLPPATLEHLLDDLNLALQELRASGLGVRVHPWLWDSVECLDDTLICDFLYQREKSAGVSPDTRRLFATLLDRCPTWDEDEPGCMDAIELLEDDGRGDSAVHDPGFSVGIALARVIAGRPVACLVFPAAPRRGFRSVNGPTGSAEIFFFARHDELCPFWRSLYIRENIKEDSFFDLAPVAFPRLVLHPLLNFGHFEGHYADIRDKAVKVLGAINDRFSSALAEHVGVPYGVAAAMGSLGVDLSPESPKTRGSSTLMAHRAVDIDGTSYLCEWHAKLDPHRNRIHFSLPIEDMGGRIVIGKFVVHLPT